MSSLCDPPFEKSWLRPCWINKIHNIPWQMFLFLFLFFSMLLVCSFFRLKQLFQVKNGLTTSFFFFFKMPKIWVGRTTLNGEKKWEDGHNVLFFLRCSAETRKINLMVCPIHVVLRSGAEIDFLLYHGIKCRDGWTPDKIIPFNNLNKLLFQEI